MMFLQYWSLGVWFVTYTSFVAANTGDQGEAIFSDGFAGYSGTATAMGSLLAPAIFGWLADRRIAPKFLLSILHGVCSVAVILMHEARDEWVFYAGLLLYFQAFGPTVSLTNTVVLRMSSNTDRDFPVLRLFGTTAWMMAGVFVGEIARRWWGESIEATRIPIAISGVSHLGMALYCLTLPRAKSPARVATGADHKRALDVLRNRPFIAFLAISMLAAIGSQAYNFANPFMNQQGYVGAAAVLTLGQLSELVCLASMPWLQRRVGLKALFLFGIGAWAARYTLLVIGSLGEPGSPATAAVIAAILCHGPAYGFMYVAGQLYVDKLVHPHNRGAGQGLHALAMNGLGHLLGAGLVGWAQSRFLTPSGVTPPPYDWVRFWLTPIGLFLVVGVLFLARFARQRPRRKAARHSVDGSSGEANLDGDAPEGPSPDADPQARRSADATQH